MPDADGISSFQAGEAHVQVYESSEAAGDAGAKRAADLITRAIKEHGKARVIAATGNSQIPLIKALVKLPVQWSAVEFFHMDEYSGMEADHPASFRRWIKERIADQVHPLSTHYLEGDAADLDAEMERYSKLLMEAPIDLAFVGFGENGHIAFNDPPVADFHDPAIVKKITLDEACRRQQSGEGHFKDVESVPKEAVSITCPGLFRARSWVCCVPDSRKAQAVKNALKGTISETCPASIVRQHPDAYVYLDLMSASLLNAGATQNAQG